MPDGHPGPEDSYLTLTIPDAFLVRVESLYAQYCISGFQLRDGWDDAENEKDAARNRDSACATSGNYYRTVANDRSKAAQLFAAECTFAPELGEPKNAYDGCDDAQELGANVTSETNAEDAMAPQVVRALAANGMVASNAASGATAQQQINVIYDQVKSSKPERDAVFEVMDAVYEKSDARQRAAEVAERWKQMRAEANQARQASEAAEERWYQQKQEERNARFQSILSGIQAMGNGGSGIATMQQAAQTHNTQEFNRGMNQVVSALGLPSPLSSTTIIPSTGQAATSPSTQNTTPATRFGQFQLDQQKSTTTAPSMPNSAPASRFGQFQLEQPKPIVASGDWNGSFSGSYGWQHCPGGEPRMKNVNNEPFSFAISTHQLNSGIPANFAATMSAPGRGPITVQASLSRQTIVKGKWWFSFTDPGNSCIEHARQLLISRHR
jgi:hypothetical protein